MRLFISLILLFISITIIGQNKEVISPDSNVISEKQLSHAIKELQSLSVKGLDLNNDSVLVSDEFKKLLKDSIYRNKLYPSEYTWEQTISYIQKTELKKAFWYLVNLYPTSEKNKKLVITSVLSYDAIIQMDKVLVNTFYTYAFTDPESSIIIDNSPEITRPDILEAKLRTVNELVQYINKYREKIKSK